MKIVVCVKQVVDVSIPIEIKDGRLAEAELAYLLNPRDHWSLELAVRIKERLGRGEVIALSFGPPRVESILRTCLAGGADRALRLYDPVFPDHDPLLTARVLAAAIATLGYDLVLCGSESLDTASGLVGAGIAEVLGVELISRVTHVEVRPNGNIVAHRQLERGDREVIECPVPVVVTVESEIYPPRYPSLPDHMAALVQEIPGWGTHHLSLKPIEVERTKMMVKNCSLPTPRPKKIFTPDSSLPAEERIRQLMTGGVAKRESPGPIEGPPQQLALRLVLSLREWGLIEG